MTRKSEQPRVFSKKHSKSSEPEKKKEAVFKFQDITSKFNSNYFRKGIKELNDSSGKISRSVIRRRKSTKKSTKK